MPKMKTNRGAAKRFKRTATGQYRYRQAFKNHILTKKTPKRKLQLRGLAVVDEVDKPMIKRLMPYS